MDFLSLISGDVIGIWREHLISLSLWATVAMTFIAMIWVPISSDIKLSLSLTLTYMLIITTMGFILLFIPGIFLPSEVPDPETYRPAFWSLLTIALIKIFLTQPKLISIDDKEAKNGKTS